MDVYEEARKAGEEFLRAVKDPEEFDFREENPSGISVRSTAVEVERAWVDTANETVLVRYSNQLPEERHICVMKEDGKALVESRAVHETAEVSAVSRMYYFVAGEEVYQYRNGWEKTLQDRPRKVVEMYDELLEKGLERLEEL